MIVILAIAFQFNNSYADILKIKGTRIAQTGPDPACSTDVGVCITIIIYQETGSPDDKNAVYDAFLSEAYGNCGEVTYTDRPAGGFFFHVEILPETETFEANSIDDVLDWIELQ